MTYVGKWRGRALRRSPRQESKNEKTTKLATSDNRIPAVPNGIVGRRARSPNRVRLGSGSNFGELLCVCREGRI